jgi:hypothetical protein
LFMTKPVITCRCCFQASRMSSISDGTKNVSRGCRCHARQPLASASAS